MGKLKPDWVRTDIPKDIKIKLWSLMIDNPTYGSWERAIVGESHTGDQDELFANDELKYIKMSRDTYNALQYEIMHMPLEDVISLPPDLQSWVMQLRPGLGSEKHPRRKVEVTEMTSLSEKYLIDHYQKLHKVLERLYDRLCTPELSELCLFTLKDRVTISRSYVSEMFIPAIIYDKGAVKLDVEMSDPFLWECLEKHLTAEFPEFGKNLGDWKKSIATIVEKCHGITKTIVDRLAQMRWDSAEPYLDPASKDYGTGVFHDILADLMYKCVMAHHVPRFQQVSDSHGLLILVMDYSTGRKSIARGEKTLLDQVQKHCEGIAGITANNTDEDSEEEPEPTAIIIKGKVDEAIGLAKQAEVMLKPSKQNLRKVLERGTFEGTCSVCADLVRKLAARA